jgi:hypothetical protein
MGQLRIEGDAGWSKWGYDEAMRYFCSQTKITFVPPLPHPEHFGLT